MPRPTDRQTLLDVGEANYLKLLGFIDALPATVLQQEFPEGTLNRNIRDVLGHLHHWHLLMQDWHEVGMAGGKPHIPAKGYTWKTNADLNRSIRALYAEKALHEVRTMLETSFQDLRQLIKRYSDAELFEKKRYSWTGSTSLGAYLISATSSHYDWAFKLIKRSTKASK